MDYAHWLSSFQAGLMASLSSPAPGLTAPCRPVSTLMVKILFLRNCASTQLFILLNKMLHKHFHAGFLTWNNELKTNLGLHISWNGTCCKVLGHGGGEGRTHIEQNFFSLSSLPSFSASSLLLPLSSFPLHLLCFSNGTLEKTHLPEQKCIINYYKMNTCVITTRLRNKIASTLETSQVLFPPVGSSIILEVNVTPNLITFICSKGQT